MKVSCIQLTSTADIAANIAKIETLVANAAAQKAEFVALPENAFYMRAESSRPLPNPPPQAGEGIKKYTQATHPGVKAAAAMAKKYKIWLLAGSVTVSAECTVQSAEKKLSTQHSALSYNRSILFNPKGEVVAHYDKIHLFDVDIGDGQTYQESARFLSGKNLALAELPWGKLGMTVCYDLRFPQLYRALAKKGAQMLAVPSAFTQVTGEAHWHVLLRARAIENACFVIAPAQTGEHPGGRKTYGHSLVVDPWGKIIADGGTKEGVVMADIDMSEVQKVRKRLPSLEHDREFE